MRIRDARTPATQHLAAVACRCSATSGCAHSWGLLRDAPFTGTPFLATDLAQPAGTSFCRALMTISSEHRVQQSGYPTSSPLPSSGITTLVCAATRRSCASRTALLGPRYRRSACQAPHWSRPACILAPCRPDGHGQVPVQFRCRTSPHLLCHALSLQIQPCARLRSLIEPWRSICGAFRAYLAS